MLFVSLKSMITITIIFFLLSLLISLFCTFFQGNSPNVCFFILAYCSITITIMMMLCSCILCILFVSQYDVHCSFHCFMFANVSSSSFLFLCFFRVFLFFPPSYSYINQLTARMCFVSPNHVP